MNTIITTVDSSCPATVRGYRFLLPGTTPRRLSSYEITAMVHEIATIEANPSAWRARQGAAVAS